MPEYNTENVYHMHFCCNCAGACDTLSLSGNEKKMITFIICSLVQDRDVTWLS